MADVTPKFIILATTKTGNHPFSHISSNSGAYDEVAEINIDAIREILNDYNDDFEDTIFIGKRAGFMDYKNDELLKLAEEFKNVELTTINVAIDNYCEQLKNQMD